MIGGVTRHMLPHLSRVPLRARVESEFTKISFPITVAMHQQIYLLVGKRNFFALSLWLLRTVGSLNLF